LTSFAPQLVGKRQTRLAGLDERILGLYAGGMSVRDIEEHLSDLYGVAIKRDTIQGYRSHPLLLTVVDSRENRWANDMDGSALAAQPGKSQGRPLKSPGSKPIAQNGLPSLRSPEDPCPSRPDLSRPPDDTDAFKEHFHAARGWTLSRRMASYALLASYGQCGTSNGATRPDSARRQHLGGPSARCWKRRRVCPAGDFTPRMKGVPREQTRNGDAQ
jgi:hypothetical protein